MFSVTTQTENSKSEKIKIVAGCVYTKIEAAEATNTSYSTIHRAIARGQLKAARVNRRVLLRAESIAAWLSESEAA